MHTQWFSLNRAQGHGDVFICVEWTREEISHTESATNLEAKEQSATSMICTRSYLTTLLPRQWYLHVETKNLINTLKKK